MTKPITKSEVLRNTKELVFSGSDWRVIHQSYGQSPTLLFSGDETLAREFFRALDAREVSSIYL